MLGLQDALDWVKEEWPQRATHMCYLFEIFPKY